MPSFHIIASDDTVEKLGLADGDLIDVVMQQTGGVNAKRHARRKAARAKDAAIATATEYGFAAPPLLAATGHFDAATRSLVPPETLSSVDSRMGI